MSERPTDEALANIAALLRDERYMMQCDGFAVMLKTAKQAATAIDELLAHRRATPADNLRAENERLTKERDALAAASWIAGRDAGEKWELLFSGGSDEDIDRPTPPTDATAALQAVMDAEWNRAIEAAALAANSDGESEWFNPVQAIRALRRNPKEGV